MDTAGEAFRREAREHDRMDGADPRACQHGNRRFWHVGHVDRDAIALRDALVLEHVGEAADTIMQFSVAEPLPFAGLVALPDQRYVACPRGQMPI